MRLTIIFPVDPSEASIHLREKLHKLFVDLGLTPILYKESVAEWTTLQIDEPAPEEKLVDKILK